MKMKKFLLSFIVLMFSFTTGVRVFAASAVNDYILNNKIKPVNETVDYKIEMQDSAKNGGISMTFNAGKPTLVIIHEVANEYTTIDSEIAYMVRNQENAFVHSFVDAYSLKTIADTSKKSWGSGPFGNRYGIQIEQTRVRSKDQFAKQIANLANWTADQLIKYDMGNPKLVSESSKDLDGNLASHKNISYKWGGTDHVDPDWYWANRGGQYFGQSYDMYQFKELVDKYYKQKLLIKPIITSTTIEGNPKNGKFSVRVKTNNVKSTIVEVPIWSNKNGQDDLKWYEAKKIKDGEYLATFDASKHNFESGAYSVHAYAYNGSQKASAVVNNNLQVSYPENTIAYSTHVQSIGWQNYVENGEMSGTSGQSLRLEGIKIALPGEGSIEYTTHVQNKGWLPWVSDNRMSGTTGQSLRLEGIKIRLTGEVSSKYDIYYRVHIQDKGWLGWAKNGESAGSSGMSKRLEGINVKLVPKGQSFNTGSDAFLEPAPAPAPIPNVNYSTHVQDIGWQKYVSNGELSGTSGLSLRLEGIKINLNNLPVSGGVSYSTHIQNIGWQKNMSDNQLSGTTGQSLRLEGIKIQLTGDLSNIYDVYYRVHIQDKGWLGWAKNGEPAGSSGMSKRLEGINIKLYKKGDKVNLDGTPFITIQENSSISKAPKPNVKPENQQKDNNSVSSSPDIPKSTEPSRVEEVPQTSESIVNDEKQVKPELKLNALNDSQKSWFENIYPEAVKLANNNNLFASVILSQTIAESAWGQSELAMNANNLFGVKADSSWTGEIYEKDTNEFVDGKSITVKAKFRKYPSQVDSLKDYVNKITGNPDRYTNVLKSKAQTFENAAQALQNGGYATDPNYANNLINRIKNYNLNALD
ncbi:glucosaminidase domain-containing protein [Floricoccus penangensis]|uniref:glucosaminidase domain-containing protein n=1 Tax=Floricoccus penangensis TaxID=1859475 RepID=UPI0020426924|nr:glucosaminidase domain-containing protein [Floricoccus penangensis]URZ87776.1 GBS Bsp-like repeat-containing protein [Floricoccus penangensis]